EHGTAQFVIPDVLKVPPISQHGNVIEIAGLFGGADKLREEVNELQTLLYEAERVDLYMVLTRMYDHQLPFIKLPPYVAMKIQTTKYEHLIVNRIINSVLYLNVIYKYNIILFTSSKEIHTLCHLYESMLNEMRDAAGDSGEFYTPRPLIRFMVAVINPRLGQTVLDPACGT